jgi:hypothetical protein
LSEALHQALVTPDHGAGDAGRWRGPVFAVVSAAAEDDHVVPVWRR